MDETTLDHHNKLVFDHTQNDFRETFGVTGERWQELVKGSVQNVRNHLYNQLISEDKYADSNVVTYGSFINLFCANATNLNEAVLLLTETTTFWHVFRKDSMLHLAVVEAFGEDEPKPVNNSDYLDVSTEETDKLYKIFKVDKERYKAIVEQILKTKRHCQDSYTEENLKDPNIGAKSFTFEYWLAQSQDLKELYLISAMFGVVHAYNEVEFNQLSPLKYE